ncbi:hypothetical protein QTN25_008379 [Entamoeba marina]
MNKKETTEFLSNVTIDNVDMVFYFMKQLSNDHDRFEFLEALLEALNHEVFIKITSCQNFLFISIVMQWIVDCKYTNDSDWNRFLLRILTIIDGEFTKENEARLKPMIQPLNCIKPFYSPNIKEKIKELLSRIGINVKEPQDRLVSISKIPKKPIEKKVVVKRPELKKIAKVEQPQPIFHSSKKIVQPIRKGRGRPSHKISPVIIDDDDDDETVPMSKKQKQLRALGSVHHRHDISLRSVTVDEEVGKHQLKQIAQSNYFDLEDNLFDDEIPEKKPESYFVVPPEYSVGLIPMKFSVDSKTKNSRFTTIFKDVIDFPESLFKEETPTIPNQSSKLDDQRSPYSLKDFQRSTPRSQTHSRHSFGNYSNQLSPSSISDYGQSPQNRYYQSPMNTYQSPVNDNNNIAINDDSFIPLEPIGYDPYPTERNAREMEIEENQIQSRRNKNEVYKTETFTRIGHINYC